MRGFRVIFELLRVFGGIVGIVLIADAFNMINIPLVQNDLLKGLIEDINVLLRCSLGSGEAETAIGVHIIPLLHGRRAVRIDILVSLIAERCDQLQITGENHRLGGGFRMTGELTDAAGNRGCNLLGVGRNKGDLACVDAGDLKDLHHIDKVHIARKADRDVVLSFDPVTELVQIIERSICLGIKAVGEWITDNGETYWIQSDYYMAKGWKELDGKWYYFCSTGSLAKNVWKAGANGIWYYLGQDGVMLTNTTTPDGYKVGADGAWIR